jgi:co-chaperonin GroES (HSP10)
MVSSKVPNKPREIPMTIKFAVGKEVLSYCKKCKASLAHIIVTISGNNPNKVECKTCKSTHKFIDPSVGPTVKKRGRKKSSGKGASLPVSEVWAKAMKDSSGPVTNYTPKVKLKKGDVILHPTFGKGIVEKTFDGTKVEVMFESDIKTLVHNL